MQYKCVPAPMGLVIQDKKDYESAVRSFADIINKEATGGWKFHSMEYISVTHQPGCLAGLFGAKEKSKSYNMLIFSNDEHIDSSIKNNSTEKKVITSSVNTDVENKPTSQLIGNQVKITRLERVVGSALLVDVRVDNKSFQLENGEEINVNVENGKHTISTNFNNDYEKLEFEINNDQKTFEIFIEPPIRIKML